MNGAVNAPLPGTVQLTSSGRQPPPIKPNNLLVWRAIAAGGPNGLAREQVVEHFHRHLDREAVLLAITCLRQVGYIKFVGTRHFGCWVASRVPRDELAPRWMIGQAEGDEDKDDEAEPEAPRTPVEVQMPARPASVFNVGEEGIPCSVRRRPGRPSTAPAAHAVAAVPAAATGQGGYAAGLGWVAPPAAQCKPEPAAAPAAPAEPPPAVATTAPPPSPTAPSPCAQHPLDAEPRQSPHFALHSDGTFEIHVDDGNDYVVLRPDTTRAMFRWLDRLGGTHLSRAVEVTS